MRSLRLPALVLLGGASAIAFAAGLSLAGAPVDSTNVTVSGQVSITSRLGSETISFAGTAKIERDPTHDDGGFDVQDLHVTSLSLNGVSATGAVTIVQSPAVASGGELRGTQQGSKFPATSFLDVNVHATVPGAGFATEDPFVLHNEFALHLVAQSSLSSWPPAGAKYSATPNPCVRMLRNTADPRSSNLWLPGEICVASVSMTISAGETTTPTATPTITPTRTQTNTPTVTNTPGPPTDTPTLGPPTDTPTLTSTAIPATDAPTSTTAPMSTPTSTDVATETPTSTDTAMPTETVIDTPTATSTGTPTHTPTRTPTRTTTPEEELGDVDCSHGVTSIDATLILQLTAGLLDDLLCDGGADVNGDGYVDSRDAALILQHVARLVGSL